MRPLARSGGSLTCNVVVCTRDRPVELERCLQSLLNLKYPAFEVIVVDNAPSTGSSMALASEYGVHYVSDPVPGLSHARNTGALLSKAEIVAYLDDDAVAEPEWVNELAKEFEDPDVMAVAGSCAPLKVETEAEHLWLQVFGSGWGPERRMLVDRNSPGWFAYTAFGGIGTGGNMAFRRSAFEVWPGFDERLGRGMPLDSAEEHHAFFSLARLGYKIAATPHAIVRHPLPETLDALSARQLNECAARMGYVCLLLAEENDFRLETLRYAFRKLHGSGPDWTQKRLPASLAPASRSFVARMRGPWLYLLSNWRVQRNRRLFRSNGLPTLVENQRRIPTQAAS